MAVYYAELECTTVLTVKFEIDDDLEPDEEDALEAARYVQNHLDSYIVNETINYIKKDE